MGIIQLYKSKWCTNQNVFETVLIVFFYISYVTVQYIHSIKILTLTLPSIGNNFSK